MKTSTALTLAAAAALCTAAAFIQNRQSAELPSTGPVAGIEEVRGPEAIEPKPTRSSATHAQSAEPSAFRVAGVLAQRKLDMPSQFGSRMPFPGSNAQVRLAIEYTSPTNDLIDWVHGECEITLFSDDRGTDLIDPDDAFGPFEMMPTLSEDKDKLAFILQSSKAISPGAGTIRAEGSIVLRRASERGTHRSKPVYLEPDAHVVCGPFDMEVTQAGPSQWSDGWEVTLQTGDDLGSVIAWSFVDEQGTRIELSPSSSISGMGTWAQSLTLPAEPETKGTLEMECWKDARSETVSFRVESGLDVGASR